MGKEEEEEGKERGEEEEEGSERGEEEAQEGRILKCFLWRWGRGLGPKQ